MDVESPIGHKYMQAILDLSDDKDSRLLVEVDDDNNFQINWYDREPIDFEIIRQRVYEMEQETPDPKDLIMQKFKGIGFSDQEIEFIFNNINT